ncbi:class I SAM-dependent methyltransferase [Methanoregula sp. UBA64]|jgi:SAM-dependent methyltransferase|uniref:class I SAM-dependent methyltransferase n=1 Tax=Methanoregula sp. UBA64 TaxID=1915554 RepID=UPI0025D206B6|nr:class I SAM-dependent methyltransferase [Methanoregula sp. UBA64]
MGELLNFVTPLHKKTKRDYLARMVDDKVRCMQKAKEYGYEYWDGDRRFGYGGYTYRPGYWRPVAEQLIKRYHLREGDKILDVGCGKSFLLYELQLLIPGLKIQGFDISEYGMEHCHQDFKGGLFKHRAQDPYPFKDKEFDLVISLACLHNLNIFELKTALCEIERVGKNKYIMVESYRNELEMFNLECWALTAESLFDLEEWIWIYKEFGYTGDYEFIYFE